MPKKRGRWDAVYEAALANPDITIKEEPLGAIDKSKPARRKLPVLDGYTFDSQGERDRYLILRDWQAKGRIRNLRVHVVYVIKPERQTLSGVSAAVKWEADFVYVQADTDLEIIEDFKGGYLFRSFKEKLPHIMEALGDRSCVFINTDLTGWYKESGDGKCDDRHARGDKQELPGEAGW